MARMAPCQLRWASVWRQHRKHGTCQCRWREKKVILCRWDRQGRWSRIPARWMTFQRSPARSGWRDVYEAVAFESDLDLHDRGSPCRNLPWAGGWRQCANPVEDLQDWATQTQEMLYPLHSLKLALMIACMLVLTAGFTDSKQILHKSQICLS